MRALINVETRIVQVQPVNQAISIMHALVDAVTMLLRSALTDINFG